MKSESAQCCWHSSVSVAFWSLTCALLVLSATSLRGATQVSVDFKPLAKTVTVYDYLEVAIHVQNPGVQNPFTDVEVAGSFQAAGEAAKRVDGFCDAADGSTFRIRFMPSKPGRHRYTVTYRQGDFTKTYEGSFKAVKAKKKGILRVDRDYPWHFVWEGT
ncbi:MAG TPA: DUF5060 domain-containing protein, partial [Clostridia bacterium]|nr:DUF5060 domain-containing protein [Clostridia bacterium]